MQTVKTDQTLHSAAPDLGLHCLPVSVLGDTRHKMVKCSERRDRRPMSVQSSVLLNKRVCLPF